MPFNRNTVTIYTIDFGATILPIEVPIWYNNYHLGKYALQDVSVKIDSSSETWEFVGTCPGNWPGYELTYEILSRHPRTSGINDQENPIMHRFRDACLVLDETKDMGMYQIKGSVDFPRNLDPDIVALARHWRKRFGKEWRYPGPTYA